MSETTLSEEEGRLALVELRDALRSDWVRVEFDTVLSLSQGSLHCVRIFLPGPTPRSKWRQVGMRIVAPKDKNTRLGMIEHLQELAGVEL